MFLSSLFANKKRRSRSRNVSGDSLEDRTLLAIVSVVVDGDRNAPNVRITGSAVADQVGLVNYQVTNFGQGTTFNVTEFGVARGIVSDYVIPHPLNNLTQLNVDLGAGNDGFVLSGTSVTLLNVHDGYSPTEVNTISIAGGNAQSQSRVSVIHSADVRLDQGTANFAINQTTARALIVNYLRLNYANTLTTSTSINASNGGRVVIGSLSITSSGANSQDNLIFVATIPPDVAADLTSYLNVTGSTAINLGGGNDFFNVAGFVTFNGFTTIETGDGADTFSTGQQPNLGGPQAPSFDHFTLRTGNGIDTVTLSDARVNSSLNVSTGNDADLVVLRRCNIVSGSIIDLGAGPAVGNLRDTFQCVSTTATGTMIALSSGPGQFFFYGTQALPLSLSNLYVIASSGLVSFGEPQNPSQGSIGRAFVTGTGPTRLGVRSSGRVTVPLFLTNTMPG